MSHVKDRMSEAPATCRMEDTLNRAAQLMWEHDCGSIPVIDDANRVAGIITDRDICMGAYTQGLALASIPVSSVCSKQVHTCAPDDTLEKAEKMMIEHQVRRLPVTDADGRILGLLSVSDLAREPHARARGKDDDKRGHALSSVMEAVTRLRTVARSKTKREHETEGDRRPAARR